MMAVLLATLVGLLAWAALATRRGGKVPWGLVAAAAAIPPLMVAASLWEAELSNRFGDVRMSLRAIQADEGALVEGVSLGGGEDDLRSLLEEGDGRDEQRRRKRDQHGDLVEPQCAAVSRLPTISTSRTPARPWLKRGTPYSALATAADKRAVRAER